MISADSSVQPAAVPTPSIALPRFLAVRGYTWRSVILEVTIFATIALSASVLGPAVR
jgi:hypothetical protein